MPAARFQSEALRLLTLAEFIASHADDRPVRASRTRYRRRRDLLLSALDGHAVEGVAAGQHDLLGLPRDASAEGRLLQRATARDLAFGLLGEHWHEPSAAPRSGLVLGYGTPRDDAFPAEVAELSALLGREVGG